MTPYVERHEAKELYNEVYNIYKSQYATVKGKLVGNINSMLPLYSILDSTIRNKYSRTIKNDFMTKNTKAMYQFIERNHLDVYIPYKLLYMYIQNKGNGTLPKQGEEEINSLLAITEVKGNSNGAVLWMVMAASDVQALKSDKIMQDVLIKHGFNKSHILAY